MALALLGVSRSEFEDGDRDWVGTRVAKNFSGTWYKGSIASFDRKDGFLIEYDDGDSEHLFFHEMIQAVADFRRPAVRRLSR